MPAAPAPGEIVVHLGAGAGYYSAVLAALVGASGSVTAVEREQDLAARAASSLSALANVEVRSASATETVIPACDVIYVNEGATHPPAAWPDAQAH